MSLPPALAFTGLAMLFSLTTRNGIAGGVGPVVVALVVQLLDLMGNGTWVHAVLPGSAFSDWHGLFTAPTFVRPLIIGSAVSLVWVAVELAICARVLSRRTFTGSGSARVARWTRVGSITLVGLLVVALLAAGTRLGPATITANRLEASLTPTFARLTLIQQRELGRRVQPGSRLRIQPVCFRQGGGSPGPGDDWTCTLDVFIPQGGVEPFQGTPVTYDMSVQANGCFKADSPPAFVGQQLIRDARGRVVVNPLFTIYGCFETDG